MTEQCNFCSFKTDDLIEAGKHALAEHSSKLNYAQKKILKIGIKHPSLLKQALGKTNAQEKN